MQTCPVTNIHEAMNQAATSQRDRIKLSNVNFKINPLKKDIAEKILAQNGATLSSFMRACVDCLIKDYAGKDAFEKIECSSVDFAGEDSD